MFTIQPKIQPKWFKIRKQAARFLVFLARKIEPNSDHVYSHLLQESLKAYQDMAIYGSGRLRVEHVPFKEDAK